MGLSLKEDILKAVADSEQQQSCSYRTPCGWCQRLEKNCQVKRGLRAKTDVYDEALPPCYHCDAYEYGDPKCPTCKKENYKYFERKK